MCPAFAPVLRKSALHCPRPKARRKDHMLSSTLSKDAPFIDIPAGIALALSQAIIDTVRDPLLVLDENHRVTAVSRSFYQTFGLAGEDVRDELLFEIDGGHWNIPELRT